MKIAVMGAGAVGCYYGAVLAREYRLPAVVGTHVGTTRLRTGQLVEVDGLVGSICLLEA